MATERTDVKLHHGRQPGLALGLALLIALAGCARTPGTTDTTPSPTPAPTTAAPTGAFFLDLRTGEQTPLPSTSGEKVDDGAPFDGGHYYAVSADGSMVYWEDTCCTASDVAAVASSDGSQGRRLDPPGPINYYAGGWSPDGTKIVYQRRDPRGPLEGVGARFFGDLVVEDMDSGRKTTVDLGLGPAVVGYWYLAPTFSSDGRNLIFQLPRESSSGPKWDLWSVPVGGGERTLLVRNAAQAATSYDGPSYAFVRPVRDDFDGSSLVIATPDGSRTLVEAIVGIFEPKMSPDGSKIAYQDGGSIYVVDISTGESQEVAVGRMAAWLDDDTLIVAPAEP